MQVVFRNVSRESRGDCRGVSELQGAGRDFRALGFGRRFDDDGDAGCCSADEFGPHVRSPRTTRAHQPPECLRKLEGASGNYCRNSRANSTCRADINFFGHAFF